MSDNEQISSGWLVPSDGSAPFELPAHQLGAAEIQWTPGDTQMKPGEPLKYFTSKDLYRPHVLKSENIYVYVQADRDPNALPESITNGIQRQLKGS